MLHLIFQATLDDNVIQRIALADVVVLLDDAVLRTLRAGNRAEALSGLLSRARCLVLDEHLAIRGLAVTELVKGIEVIDYADLVNLTVTHALIQTWC